jgi:hypothetical protein
MREYIYNLTNNLIGKHNFVAIWEKMQDRKGFLSHVKMELEVSDVSCMKPETLGRVMCSFESGEVVASREELSVGFDGRCDGLLRELVSLCLAYVIRERVAPTIDTKLTGIVPYRGISLPD